MSTTDLETVAARVRANIKAAQKSGELDPRWEIKVRTYRHSTCVEVAAYIQGDAVTDEFLTIFHEDSNDIEYTSEALALAGQVKKLMAPADEWQGNRYRDRVVSVYWGEGLPACW